jgi:hypothetical protein
MTENRHRFRVRVIVRFDQQSTGSRADTEHMEHAGRRELARPAFT